MRKRGIAAGVIGVTVLSAAALRGMLRRFTVREASMAPHLVEGDWVMTKRRTGTPDRGDIVIFSDPTGSGLNLVKRVIGLPGEHVGVEGGRVTINGALLADRWASGSSGPNGGWSVPDAHVWLLGDNRSASSSDGRVLGPTPLDDIEWVVIGKYWPSKRTAKLQTT